MKSIHFDEPTLQLPAPWSVGVSIYIAYLACLNWLLLLRFSGQICDCSDSSLDEPWWLVKLFAPVPVAVAVLYRSDFVAEESPSATMFVLFFTSVGIFILAATTMFGIGMALSTFELPEKLGGLRSAYN